MATRRAPNVRIGALALGLVLVCALSVLLVEGAASLVFGRSLRDRQPAGRTAPQGGRERAGASQREAGIYQVHEDPRTGLVLKANARHEILGAPATADARGMRQRPGAPPPDDALRIVLLGDSVAFGYGVADDEVLAAAVERALLASRGEEAVPAAACFTIALPGWNHWNASSFLLDHLDEIDPDLVVYLPIGNDVADGFGVNESGQRRRIFDTSQADPWLQVSFDMVLALEAHFVDRVVRGDMAMEGGQAGPYALASGLGRVSSRRHDDNARTIADLHGELDRLGIPLLLAHYNEEGRSGPYVWLLRQRLLERGAPIREIPLLSRTPHAYSLAADPHPSASCLATLGVWIAEALLESGYVSRGAGRPLPGTDPDLEALRVPQRSPAEVRARVERELESARGRLRSRIDLETGEGFRQVLGGLHADLTMGPRAAFLVRGDGPEVEISVSPLSGSVRTLPVSLRVEIDGEPAGRFDLGAGAQPIRLARPPPALKGAPVEVKLIAERWSATTFPNRQQLASCRIRSIACDA